MKFRFLREAVKGYLADLLLEHGLEGKVYLLFLVFPDFFLS